ncbi:40S ribosomal protein S27-like [Hippopotamus amphibius kiboko]|uniref:40S ribosomal protein S27-like n=1 Tax=Hippopotamus amphibius kiboko TaxID=575201 RepID=UPI002595A0F3|nr:40S ribosomal protein S27-like [Hippopotamus amphibius kiboko]
MDSLLRTFRRKKTCGHFDCKPSETDFKLQPSRTNKPLTKDLLHSSPEKKKHKKCLVQSPNSYFMDVKCPKCYKITSVFSHAQTFLCVGCSTILCQLTEGKARLTEGCSFRQKQH